MLNNSSAIRLLASGNNERGDLFTRLTKDLFFALGYDDLRLDVHKSGRELDIQGQHRFEPRRVVGECKAHAAKMGGDDLNKFFGALARERTKYAPTPVAGYFVSLGGFKETAREQEIETGNDRLILLDSDEVVTELEKSRVVVERAGAVERAGRCAQHAGLRDAALDAVELLGHQRGYLWAVFYAGGKERTHVALIHADGTPLAAAVAQEVIDADRLCGGSLHLLQYLAPALPAQDRSALAAQAAAGYRQWLEQECGYIHLDGLPADTDLSATRLRLERLFVPLKATFLPKTAVDPNVKEEPEATVLSIGEVLRRAPHLALLAIPGGGKSTLLKRLAMAYAFPERRGEVAEDLPEREWLPLILRCRELRDRAHRPILELLDDIPRHAGMNADELTAFGESIHTALRAGQGLLLVDGLDEIADEGARQTFAGHLRTFVAMFPQAALVVTSREAGFRLVAGVIAGICEQAKLAPLDQNDVLSLCERWHVEVVGDTEKVRAEAKELAGTIWENERIRTLAQNPLLLTTLLVVKRSIRELPRSRTALYREAIRVLIRTWNVEGYTPLDEDETLAQLSYVACAMMEEGKQQIGQKALLKLLRSARQELEAELQFTRISPQEFIERIEYRSSLLMQVGHERSDDVLEPVYEFRHLTFQEYLAARGYVEEQYPGRNFEQALAEILERRFEDEHWREVIPLAAVLAGRKAEELVKRLIEGCGRSSREERFGDPRSVLLLQCIRDEVQVPAPILRMALQEMARDRWSISLAFKGDWITAILRGKFGTIFQEVVEHTYLKGGEGFEEYLDTLPKILRSLHLNDLTPETADALGASLLVPMETGDRVEKLRAAVITAELAFDRGFAAQVPLESLSDGLIRMVASDDLPSALVACWAFALLGQRRLLANRFEPEVLLSVYRVWRRLGSSAQGRYPAWALAAQRLLPRDTFAKAVWGDCESFLAHAAAENDNLYTRGALVVGWYRRAPWSDAELVEQISKLVENPFGMQPTLRELLENLGDAGRRAIDEWDRKRADRAREEEDQSALAKLEPAEGIEPPTL